MAKRVSEKTKTVNALQKAADNMRHRRDNLIESVWRAVVKDDIPKSGDGELTIRQNMQTEDGVSNIYIFMYKGEEKARLIETSASICEWHYFIQSEEISIEQIMKEYEKIAKNY